MTNAVGMSGGLDSTIAAFILKKNGADLVGLTMKIWEGEGDGQSSETYKSGCYGPGEAHDIRDAERACEKLGIPHHVLDLTSEYSQTILNNFSSEYLLGRTPNPCVLCNPTIKFGAMLRKARDSGIVFSKFATGHYARISFDQKRNRYLLRKGVDPLKDQSYYLYRLNQIQLGQILFPLGEFTKQEIRQLAIENGFSEFASKPESQNFFDDGHYQSLFENEEKKAGEIVDLNGNIVGNHPGIHNFTIGQRKGLNLGGLPEPVYVIEKDADKNTITVGPKESLKFRKLQASSLNWISFENLETPIQLLAHYRYRQPTASCQVIPVGIKNVEVIYDQFQYAASPGQSIVFYLDDEVIGGGIIDSIQSVRDL